MSEPSQIFKISQVYIEFGRFRSKFIEKVRSDFSRFLEINLERYHSGYDLIEEDRREIIYSGTDAKAERGKSRLIPKDGFYDVGHKTPEALTDTVNQWLIGLETLP
jgi:hypothetical protein